MVFHGPILANFFFLKNIYIRDIKSNEKPLRTILLNSSSLMTGLFLYSELLRKDVIVLKEANLVDIQVVGSGSVIHLYMTSFICIYHITHIHLFMAM